MAKEQEIISEKGGWGNATSRGKSISKGPEVEREFGAVLLN